MKTTIAINLGHKFVAIEAEIIEVLGITVGIHKSINASGWTASHVGTGIAFCSRRKNRVGCIERVTDLITRRGTDKVNEQIEKLASTPAPATNTLKHHCPVVKPKAVKANISAIVEAVHNTVPLTEREQAAVVAALNSRTGQLKAKSPSAFGTPDEQLACAAWQGLQPNGYKIGTLSCICLRGEARELFDKLAKVRWPAALDKDKAALVAIGAW
jgi:hypothetical protein